MLITAVGSLLCSCKFVVASCCFGDHIRDHYKPTIHEITRKLAKKHELSRWQNHSPLLSKRYLPANLAYTSDAESAPDAATPCDKDREFPFAPEGLLSSADRSLRRTRIPTPPLPRQIHSSLRAS